MKKAMKKRKKRKRMKKKLKRKLKKSTSKKKGHSKKKSKETKQIQDGKDKTKEIEEIVLDVTEKAKAMAPMTKEEWEKRQSIIRRIYDEETGRHR